MTAFSFANIRQRLAGYAGEMVFAARATQTPASFASLVYRTLRFHLHNGRLLDDAPTREIALRIDIGGTARTLTVRTGPVGDLFILYEILQRTPYFIPDALLDPASVRTIVDCGANIGIAALYLAVRYPRATIYSVEPHPENFHLLVRNAAQESRIVPVQAGVVGASGQQIYITSDRPGWGNTTGTEAVGIPVPGTTIEELCDRFSLQAVDLLKVDIEGAEREVFASAEFMRLVRFAIIELHEDYGLNEFERDIAPWGCRPMAPGPVLGTKLPTVYGAARATGRQS